MVGVQPWYWQLFYGLWYSTGLVIILKGHITGKNYVNILNNQVHLIAQTLFPNDDVIYRDDNVRVNIFPSIGFLSNRYIVTKASRIT